MGQGENGDRKCGLSGRHRTHPVYAPPCVRPPGGLPATHADALRKHDDKMKLVLHIGTHKTATTSIQHFCALNRAALRKYGYFYPRIDLSAYVANFLASGLAHGREAEVAARLLRARSDAAKAGCHTVVISAESFYAMTTSFVDIPGRPREDYWVNEQRLIEKLRDCCEDLEVRVLAYLRPQDEFASSLYNQLVKNVFGIDHSYDEFIGAMRLAFDYEGHFALWEKIFGSENVRLRNFLACRDRVITDFCETALEGSCLDIGAESEIFSNRRLTRDVLEVKRIFNRTKPDRSLAYVAARMFDRISDDMPDRPGYQVFATSDARRRDFAQFEQGNVALAERHDLGRLPTVNGTAEPMYPGLTMERAVEAYLRYRMAMDRPRPRAELALRRIANLLKAKVPGGERLLRPVRKANNYLRLRLDGF